MNTLIKNFFSSRSNCLIIAEIGVNHNGDINLAKKMIDAAKSSGADVVKFQTFKAEKLVSKDTPKVKYQFNSTSPEESHYDMLKKLELSYEDHFKLKEYCKKINIVFISTPYDIESAKFLLDLDVGYFKTASADLIDLPLHQWIAKTRKPSIISVGMSTIEEIQNTVDIYNENMNKDIVLLHCVSNYPCSDASINLNVMNNLKNTFMLPIGYSDHSLGNEASILSIGKGACVIEKHFTIDKNLPGPDHQASSNPIEFKNLVNSIRRAEKILGSPEKKVQEEELEMAKISRKSLFLKESIKVGEILELKYLELKRPGTGLLAKDLKKLIGKKANKNLNAGHQVKLVDFNE